MDNSPSLYERIGGAATVSATLDTFYERVLSDPNLAPFFQNVTMEKLIRMQREFFAAALGGPETYSGLSLAHAHQGRGITPRHFAQFTGHLLETLRSRGISERDADEIISRINTYADEIVGGTTVSE